jgi:hypothetical protein
MQLTLTVAIAYESGRPGSKRAGSPDGGREGRQRRLGKSSGAETGPAELAPGVTILPIGGHTPGMQSATPPEAGPSSAGSPLGGGP